MKNCAKIAGVLAASLSLAVASRAGAQSFGPQLNGSTSEAHNHWRYQSQQARQLLGEAKQAEAELGAPGAGKTRLASLKREVTMLEAEKARALADMRAGAFCRACHRTRSQIEATGESWQHHLDNNSGGQAIAATQQELDDKAKEYDDKIADKQNAAATLEKRISHLEWVRTTKSNEADNARSMWVDAVRAEGQHRQQDWDQKRLQLEAQYHQVEYNLNRAVAEYNQKSGLSADARSAMQAGMDALRSQLANLKSDAAARRDEAQSGLAAWMQEWTTDRDELAAIAGSLSDNYLLAGSILADGYKVNFTYGLAYAGFAVGATSGGVNARGVGSGVNDAKSFLESGGAAGGSRTPSSGSVDDAKQILEH